VEGLEMLRRSAGISLFDVAFARRGDHIEWTPSELFVKP
jgi:hypothetical protein